MLREQFLALASSATLELLSALLLGGWLVVVLLLPLFWRRARGKKNANKDTARGRLAARLEGIAGPTRLASWQDQLQRAGVPLRPGELYGLALLVAAIGTVLLDAWLGYPLLALAGGLALSTLPFWLVLRRANRQEHAFLHTLQSTCRMLAGAALSGSRPERLLVLLSETPAPLGIYFQEIVQRVPSIGHLAAIEEAAARPHPPQLGALFHVFRLYFVPGGGGALSGQLTAVAEDIALSLRLSDDFRIKLERISYQYWLVIGIAGFVLLYLRFAEPGIATLFLSSIIGQVYLLVLASFALLMGRLLKRLTRLPGQPQAPRHHSGVASKGGRV
jgi:Flp pilus assembly protein TadB